MLLILIGSGMIILTVVMESFFIAAAVSVMNTQAHRLSQYGLLRRTVVLLSALTLWLLAGITIALWLWAGLFLMLGEFSSLGEAVYFSSVSATTLGYGDVLLSDKWRLLSGFIAANGLVLFSLNTAFLFEALRRVNDTVPPGSSA